MALIAAAIREVRRRITQACLEVGRDPSAVRLLPMSKNHSVADIIAASEEGVTTFGESRPQELATKATELAGSGIRFAFAGHLQTNKAALIIEHASEFHALDSIRLARELNKRAQATARRLPVLVQVNTSGEVQKYGLGVDEVIGFAREIAHLDGLEVRGLMTMAMASTDPIRVGSCFDRLAAVQQVLRCEGVPGSWDELSMGMSGDFELAIASGSTCVRIGSAIFGAR